MFGLFDRYAVTKLPSERTVVPDVSSEMYLKEMRLLASDLADHTDEADIADLILGTGVDTSRNADADL